MQVDELVPFPGVTEEDMAGPLSGLITNLNDSNPTFQAIQEQMCIRDRLYGAVLRAVTGSRQHL